MSKLKVNEIEAYTDGSSVKISSELTFTEDAVFQKDVTVKGNLILGDHNTDTIDIGAEIISHLVPDDGLTLNLGTTDQKWNNLHLQGTVYSPAGEILDLEVTDLRTVTAIASEHITLVNDDPSPSAKLDLAGNDSRLRLWGTVSTFPNPAVCAINADPTLNSWINNGANFGIGTSDPNSLLHLESTAFAYQQFTRKDTSINDGDSIGGLLFGGTTDDGTTYNYNSAVIVAEADGVWDTAASESGSKLQFRTTPNGDDSWSTQMTIRGSGNVGVGTEEPNQLLHLESSQIIAFQQFTRKLSPGLFEDGQVIGGLLFGGSSNDGADYKYNSSVIKVSADGDWDAAGDAYGSKVQFVTTPDGSDAENIRMTIMGSGKVGIGILDPDTLLHVNGDATIAGDLIVNGTTTTINSATITVDDNNIELNATGTAPVPSDATANGGGITLKGDTDKTIIWVNDTDSWHFNQGINVMAGSVGIGTADPTTALSVAGDIFLTTDNDVIGRDDGITRYGNFQFGTDRTVYRWGGYDQVTFLDSGVVGVGTTSPEHKLHVQNGAIALMSNSAATGEQVKFKRSRNETAGEHGIVNGGDTLGRLQWYGSDGVKWVETASITTVVNGVPDVDDMPGKLKFATTPIGSDTPVTAMVIDNAGFVGVGISIPTALLHVDGGAIIAGTISGVTDPAAPQQVATKNYVDTEIVAAAEDLGFQGDLGGGLSIDLGSETLTFVGGAGVTTTGAVNSLTIDTDALQPHITEVGDLADLTVVGDLQVDTDTLKVNSGDDRVGVRTNLPSSSLGINGSIGLPVATVDNIVYAATEDDYTILGNTAGAGADITVNLPNPADCGGRIYNIKKISGAHDIIITPSVGLIDGAATKLISTTWVSVTIQSNGTNWFIL